MKNIIKIFKNDIKNLKSSKMAIIILVGLIFIPGIYAWLNIDSNWNPYDNTGNLPIAIVNKDKGVKLLGQEVNMGEMLEENLKSNNAMKWIFTTEEDGMENVEKSKYYGLIIIPEDFSNSLSTLFEEDEIKKPEFDFYVNNKKNPIAPIIVNKAITTIQNSINQSFINTVIYKVVDTAEDIDVISKGAQTTDELIEKLQGAKAKVTDLRAILKTMDLVADSTANSLNAVRKLLPTIDEISGMTKQGIKDMQNAAQSFDDTYKNIENDITSIIGEAENTGKDIIDIINKTDSSNITENLDAISEKLDQTLISLKRLQKTLNSISNVVELPGIKALENRISEQISKIEKLQETIAKGNQKIEDINSVKEDINSISGEISGIKKQYQDTVKADLENAYKNASQSVNNATNLMLNLNVSLDRVDSAMQNMIKALENTGELTENIDIVLSNFQEDIDKVIEGLEEAQKSEFYYKIVNLLKNNPSTIADFLSNPVQTNEIGLYEIDSYGSKMAPFYSVLACWVGCTLLSSILKSDVRVTKELEGVKHYEKFFGRFLLFAILAMLQGLIIGIGDMILQVQVISPISMLLTLMLSSMVFMLIIYSLTMAFGKVGQALSIVIMVLQVAGSGGTFPIELLPRLFQILQPYMPFYPAMNAVRETIGGFYQNDYIMYILLLLCHTIIPLTLGLIISKKTAKIRRNVHKELHKTDIVG